MGLTADATAVLCSIECARKNFNRGFLLLLLVLLQVGLMEDSNLCALHGKRMTIM
jgi:hypothetical protein